MKYWLDTEFIEQPCTIDLISIGIVAEDDRTYYAESAAVVWSRASQWVLDNVRPHLGDQRERLWPTEIAQGIVDFIGDDQAPEFWGYYSDYDWVVFCWLFGTMMDLPARFPMFCRDVKQLAVDLGDPELPKQDSTEHNALADALWTRDAWEFLGVVAAGGVTEPDRSPE